MIQVQTQEIIKQGKLQSKLTKTVVLNPQETVFFVMDMWDKHWCDQVNNTIQPLADKINETIKKCREKGITIIHMPADCMRLYQDFPQRKSMMNVPLKFKSRGIYQGKSHNILLHGGFFPVQMSKNGGCPCQPVCKNEITWTQQHPSIEIMENDLISDHPLEVYNFLKQNNIKNIIYAGLHANVCLLKRPLGIRKMKSKGFNCYLCRDLTDIMYDPKMPPKTTHQNALEIVLDYIELRLCPTIASESL
jgi:nicotinamidase-related amidase